MLDYTKKEFGGKKIDYSNLAEIPKNRVVPIKNSVLVFFMTIDRIPISTNTPAVIKNA